MQYFLPSVRDTLRSVSSSKTPATLVAFALSRLHALIILGRLKRQGVGTISALAAPGEMPEGIAPLDNGRAELAFVSVLGEPIEVVGPLKDRLEGDEGRTFEEGLHAAGLNGEQTAHVLGAADAGRVTLWIDSKEGSELSAALDVFEANGVKDVFAVKAGKEQIGVGLPGAVLA